MPQQQLLKVTVLIGNEEGDSGDPAQGTKMPAAAQQPLCGSSQSLKQTEAAPGKGTREAQTMAGNSVGSWRVPESLEKKQTALQRATHNPAPHPGGHVPLPSSSLKCLCLSQTWFPG